MAKRSEQTDQTKADLRQAFWQLYAAAPIERITVAQVCERAGYNRGTFYRYFHDVYDVLDAIEADMLARLSACVATCMDQLETGASPEAAMQQVLATYEDNREVLCVLLGPQGDPAFTEQLKSQLKPLWSSYVLHRQPSEETDLVLEFTLSGALFTIRRWLQNPGGVSAEKVLHLLYHSALGR